MHLCHRGQLAGEVEAFLDAGPPPVYVGFGSMVATAARAGVPQIVFPYMSDQFAWRSQVRKLGLGPNGGLLRMLSARSLSRAVLECLGNDRYKGRAEEVASAIRATDGVALTVRAVESIQV